MKKLILILVAVFTVISVNAQKEKKVMDTIMTSSECGMCKITIEDGLNYVKGISFAELDVPTKKLVVKYKVSLITLEEIRILVSNLGYDADDLEANEEAYNNLPKCCKKGAHSNDNH
jgi:periplasmic mercuric ion binding protein